MALRSNPIISFAAQPKKWSFGPKLQENWFLWIFQSNTVQYNFL